MEFTTTDYKRCTVVKGSGRIDSSTAPDLEKTLNDLLSTDKDIILDMSEINFVSSAGWWAIIRVQKELKKKRTDLILVQLNENVRDSMNLVGILPYFSIFEKMEDALGSL